MENSYQNNTVSISRKLLLLVFAFTVLIPFVSKSQVLQVESYESTIFPAPGWKQGKAVTASTGSFMRQAVATCTQPGAPGITAATGGGANMMMLNSATAPANDTAYMYSKPFDFSNCGATNPTFQFQVYRDGNFTSNIDQIQVFVNSSPTIVGATAVNHQGGVNFISRPNTAFPAVTANTWNTYTFTLSAAAYNGGAKKTYIILLGRCQGGYNMYVDDFRVNTFPSAAFTGDVSMAVVQQNLASVGLGATNQWIIGVRCILGGNSGCGDVAAGTAVKLDSLLLNTNGTNNINDIQNAKVWYTGGSQQFSTGYISPFPTLGGNRYPTANFGQTIGIPATNLDFINTGGNCFHLEYDTTYFWLSYDIKPTATGGNFVDGDFRGAVVTPGGGACPTPGGNASSVAVVPDVYEIPGGPQIDIPYCVPTYTVGTKWANYTNNDYVQRVEFLTGVPPAFINTNINSVSVQDPAAPGYPNCAFAGHPPDYELRPNSGTYGGSVILTQGQNYSFRAQCGTWYSSNYIQAWIDYNRNGVFEASEKCTPTPSSLTSSTWQTFTASVPAAGYTGTTRLRVREVYATSNPDPCSNYTYGECEDFNITILPNCPSGYKLWLGNTSNWADPANWCGGVPTSADSARIDKSSPQIVTASLSRNYYYPIIYSGTKANTKGLFISSGDTLEINAPNPADTALRVHSSLWLNGKMIVKGGYTNSVVIANGTIENNIYTPFRGSVTDARTQVLYSAAELTAQGLVAGDRITAIGFTITPTTALGLPGKNSTQPFGGFTISYGLISGATTQFATNVPLSTPTVVFGPTNFSTVSGPQSITLATPIVWDGTSSMVIQYCFDNPSTTGNDLIKITQTTGRKTILLLTASTANIASGCVLSPGVGVSDNFFSSAGINRPNFTFTIDRIYKKALIGLKGDWNNNGTFTPGNSMVIMDSSAAQNIQGTSFSTFHELNVAKTALANTVTLQGNITVQDTLSLTQGMLMMNKKQITIENSSPTNNPGGNTIGTISGPLSRTSGLLVSEDSLAKLNWVIGTVPGSAGLNGLFRVIPFGNVAQAYIPFSFRHLTGDLGTYSVATYLTTSVNVPWPPTVSHMNDTGSVGTNNSAAAVDRFWITNKGSNAASLDLAFRWTAAERASVLPLFNSLSNPPRAYPWRISPNNMGAWLKLYSSPANTLQLATAAAYTQAANSTFDSVRVAAFDYPTVVAGLAPWFATSGPMPNYLPWSVAGSSNAGALPVELLSFNATQVGKKVKLDWSTASEINNDYFVVERSDEYQNQFDYIAKVRSWFNNSNIPLYYEAWDDRPLDGLSYYRLKQVDLDGKVSFSPSVPVVFNSSRTVSMPFDLLNTYADQLSTGNINLEFSYNSELPLTYTITDATGRLIATGSGIAAQPGVNRITLNHTLTRGMYIVTLRNEKESVSRRFVY